MTADTYSPTLGYLTMGTGNDNNSWGGNANSAVFQIFEDAIANVLTSSVTGGTLDLSGTPPPAAASQTRYAALVFTGTLGSNQTIIVPNLTKFWWVQNNTAGSFTLSIKTTAGSAVAVSQGTQFQLVFCDGANAITVGLPVTGNQTIPSGAEQDYAGIELPSGWLWQDGTAYSRTTYANLFAALTKTCTGNTHTNTTLDNLSVDLRGKGLEGATIEGTGIPTSTTISSIASATSLTLSQAATGTATGVAIRILPQGNGDGATTFNVPDRRYRTTFGRDNMNNNPASRSSGFAGTKLVTFGGEELHILTVAESAALTYSGTTLTENANHTHNYSGTTNGQSVDHTHAYNTFSASNGTAAGGNPPGGSASGATSGGSSNDHTHTYSGTSGLENQAHAHTFSGTTTGGGGAHNNMPPFGITNKIIKV